MTRWNLTIPDSTDRAVRSYLAQSGDEQGDISNFVDKAVRRRVFDLTVDRVKSRNAQHEPQAILDLIEEELEAARADRA